MDKLKKKKKRQGKSNVEKLASNLKNLVTPYGLITP